MTRPFMLISIAMLTACALNSSEMPVSEDHLRDRCDPPPRQSIFAREHVNYGRYFVTNETSAPIRISGATLYVSEVAPNTTVAIFDAVEGTGGHVKPTNFFGAFVVEGETGTLYSGVKDEDWIDRGSHCGRQRYELVIRSPQQ